MENLLDIFEVDDLPETKTYGFRVDIIDGKRVLSFYYTDYESINRVSLLSDFELSLRDGLLKDVDIVCMNGYPDVNYSYEDVWDEKDEEFRMVKMERFCDCLDVVDVLVKNFDFLYNVNIDFRFTFLDKYYLNTLIGLVGRDRVLHN